MFEMGHTATSALLSRVDGQDVRSRPMKPVLQARESTLGVSAH